MDRHDEALEQLKALFQAHTQRRIPRPECDADDLEDIRTELIEQDSQVAGIVVTLLSGGTPDPALLAQSLPELARRDPQASPERERFVTAVLEYQNQLRTLLFQARLYLDSRTSEAR